MWYRQNRGRQADSSADELSGRADCRRRTRAMQGPIGAQMPRTAYGDPRPRACPHSGRALGRPNARRSRRRRDQGRAQGRRRRHPRLGPAVRRRRGRQAISAPPITIPPIAASARSNSISRASDGKRIVRKLAARSDILIENFKVGGLAKFGLDYKSLAPDNPRLIYCSVTGFGQDGPYAHARRLRPDGAGHGRHHGAHRHGRTASRCASAWRLRTSSPASIRRSAFWRRWRSARRTGAAAMSTPRCSIRRSASSPIRR